jgi:dolichol-phosphate mannosyltransferase
MRSSVKSVDIVVSVYNEKDVLKDFWKSLTNELTKIPEIDFNIIFVNDGSIDNSQIILEELSNQKTLDRVKTGYIQFSRNYGHEAAMIAGIDYSESDVLICLDADLQHPPSLIKEMLERYLYGFDIILMERNKRMDNGIFKNLSSRIFYFIINRLTKNSFNKNSSDFFLISKKVADILKSNFRERNRFIRGYIQIIGFDKSVINYNAPAREKGASSYSTKKLLKLAFNAFYIFSNKLLGISLIVSLLFLLFSIVLIIYSIYQYFWGVTPPSGYTTLILFNSLSFTILFFLLSILSIYFGKIIDEVKDRPIYLVKSQKLYTRT